MNKTDTHRQRQCSAVCSTKPRWLQQDKLYTHDSHVYVHCTSAVNSAAN